MRFDDLDKRMRVYETASDREVPPDIYMIARLDGRGFSSLTAEGTRFKKPFDDGFRWIMEQATKNLMNTGFNVEVGYHQSDEISLLFAQNEQSFNRKLRKYNSILAGVASATFTAACGQVVAFDCRVSELPTKEHVRDYFLWRTEDAHRNCLNTHCYWLLRHQGMKAKAAANKLKGCSRAEKHELLFQNGIIFEELPEWQRYGSFYRLEEYEKEGWNPVLNRAEVARRRRIVNATRSQITGD